jgi:hypothetical protein
MHIMFKQKWAAAPIQKWGGIASFLMAIAFVTSALIYLTGNLRDAMGPFAYSLADFLYGPVWAASLVTAVIALRERIGTAAKTRMNLALLASFAAACAFVVVASIRSSNRHCHLIHPELHLESSELVLTVWGAQVAGAIGAAFHFLGWAFLLIGTAGWSFKRIPRILSVLYLLTGAMCLIVFLLPAMEPNALALTVIVCIWQGFLLLQTRPGDTQASEINPNQHN